MAKKGLKRNLSFINMVALSAGAVIGGWLVEAPYWFETTGAGAAFIFPILACLLIPVGFIFGELTSMLPFASGIGTWTANAYGHKLGFLAQWMMFLVQVVEPPMMAFIFGTVLNYFVPVSQTQMILLAIGVTVLWYVLSNFDIKLAGRLSTILFFAMVIISLVVSIYFFTSDYWSIENIKNYGGFFPLGKKGVFIAMAVFSLKYIGFEMSPTLIEETNFPRKDIWKIILSALLVPALLYLLVVLAIGGMAPWEEIAGMSMPEPEIVAKYNLIKTVGVLAIISGLLHAFTTLMGFWTSASRILYGASKLKQLPKSISKLNNHGQPYIANTIVLAFSVFFCLFSGTDWVQYIYAMSSIAAGIVYLISCMDFLKLRKVHPEWERPFKAPAGKLFFVLGIIISAWICIGASMELNMGGWISLAIFIIAGVVLYGLQEHRRKNDPSIGSPITLTPENAETDF